MRVIKQLVKNKTRFKVPASGIRCATGVLLVGGITENNAGISGVVDSGEASIRFYAGATYQDRNLAPFRVQDDGKVFMTNAVVSGEIEALSGKIGSWAIDYAGLVDLTGHASIEVTRPFGGGGFLKTLIGAAATSPNVDTQIGSEAVAAQFESTRNYANGFNVAIRAVASGGIGGGKAGDFIGNVAVSETLSAKKIILTNSLNIALDVNGRIVFNGLPHTNTLAGYTTLVRRNSDGWIFTYG